LESGIDPNVLWELCEDFGYRVDIALLSFSEEGGYDVIFRRDSPDLPIIRWASFERVCRMKGQSDANYPLLRRLQNFIGDQARQMCSRLLPSYMIPSTFMVVDHLPMTSHGKIDYKRLPLPVQTKSRHKSQPINETEHRLCQLVEQVLGQEGVGIEDNFFHLGGDSISSIRLI